MEEEIIRKQFPPSRGVLKKKKKSICKYNCIEFRRHANCFNNKYQISCN